MNKAVRMSAAIACLLCFTLAVPGHAGDLRAKWKKAKKQAEKDFSLTCHEAISEEKDSAEKKRLKKLCTFFRFKGDFGPDLDKFEKAVAGYEAKKDAEAMAWMEEKGRDVKCTAKSYLKSIRSRAKEWKKARLPYKDWYQTLARALTGIRREVKEKEKSKLEVSRAEVSHWNITRVLEKSLGARYEAIRLPAKHEVSLSIKGSNAISMADNPVIHQLFYDAAWEQLKYYAKALKSTLAKIDKDLSEGSISGKAAQRQIEQAYGSFEKKLARNAVKAINSEWKKYKKENDDYSAYKIGAGFRVAGQTAGIVTGAAGLATTGWTAVGGVSSIIGLVKSVIEVSGSIRTLFQDADEIGAEIEQEFDDLEKDFRNADEGGGKEIAKAAFERLTGIAMNTVKRIEGKVGTYQGKLKGCKVRSLEQGRDLKRLLARIDLNQERARAIEAAAKKDKGLRKALKDYGSALKKLETELNAMLTLIAGEMASYRKGADQMEDIETRLSRLQAMEPSWAGGVKAYVLPLLDFAYAATAGTTGDVIQKAIVTTGKCTAELAAEAAEAEAAVKEAVGHGLIAADNVDNLVALFK